MRRFLAALGSDARFDPIATTLYSTDASNHQVQPLGVVLPRHADEVAAIVARAAELELPVLPRGAGTSLGGQAVGACLVLDTSRYLARIVSIDPERGTAIVEPGVVCQTLNAAAGRLGLAYGPDPASADRATFGGMIGNNATGAHSIRYGMSADHLVRARVVLGDGTITELGKVSIAEAERRSQGTSVEAAVYRTALELRGTIGDELRRSWPRTWRRSSGYGLNYLVGWSPGEPPAWYRAPEPYVDAEALDLASAFCGSEGTLGVLVEAEVRLVPKRKATALRLLPFDSVVEACRATPALLEMAPSAIELIPAALIERAREVPAYARRLGFIETVPRAMLAVEFEGETPGEAEDAAGKASGGTLLLDPGAQAAFWEVRRAGLGLLMEVPGDTKAITFVEDVSVPVGSLATYVERVERILAEHATFGEWYAHASAGCLHLRPMINLKTADGRIRMRRIAEAIVQEVFDLRGAVSGEHGDGLSHTEFNERLFGQDLTGAFRRFKRAFDPKGILNPGKVVVLPGAPLPAINGQLRYHDGYGSRLDVRTHFAFRREQGFVRALESCSGVGVCRKDGGVMCPSFQATREESDSTRGRANALRAALTGWLPVESLLRPEMYRVLDLCLECKGCKAECPSGVDMARVKAEFLSLYQARHGLPLRSRLFGEIARLQQVLSRLAPIHNRLRRLPAFRWAQQAVLGVDRRRVVPAVARRPFRDRVPVLPATGGRAERVLLFVDSFTDRNEPEVGEAAQHLLRSAGLTVGRAEGQVCCGRPMISKGMLDRARAMARRNIDVLAPYAEAGVPILGLEPSCLLTLRDEYLEFFPGDSRARAVACATRLLEELLLEPHGDGPPLQRLRFRAGPAVLFHNHCHARALVGSMLLGAALGVAGEARETSAGCCGMAGSFGYEAEHYDLSMRVGEMRLFPEVRQAAASGLTIVAPGMSCRTQIRDGTGSEALHPAVLLAERLEASE